MKQGKRRGSSIHLKTALAIDTPLPVEFRESRPVRRWPKKKQQEDSSGGAGETSSRSAWTFHISGVNTASPRSGGGDTPKKQRLLSRIVAALRG